MLRAYHRRTVERANAAAASESTAKVFTSVTGAAVVWAIPALLAVVICLAFGLTGTASLYVSVPLVAISIVGGCIYIGWIYGRALLGRR